MIYFILGSNSFAGASLVDFLLSAEHQVVGISRSEQPHVILQPYAQNKNLQNFIFHSLDVNTHQDEIIALLRKYKPQYIVDFAGQGMVAESWKNPEQWYLTNIVAKVRLHDFLRTCDFLQRYVRVSTPEVYGSTDQMVSEDQHFNPSTPYAISHAAVDMSVLAFYRQYQFPAILTRFANFYGPHQQLYRIVPRTIIYALTGKKLPLHGGGTAKRAFIYSTDVARALDTTIRHGKVGETYHFSSGDCISIADLVQMLCRLMQIDYDQFIEKVADRPGKDNQYLMNAEKAHKELNWRPLISLEQGLKYSIDWVKQNIAAIKQLPLEYIHKA